MPRRISGEQLDSRRRNTSSRVERNCKRFLSRSSSTRSCKRFLSGKSAAWSVESAHASDQSRRFSPRVSALGRQVPYLHRQVSGGDFSALGRFADKCEQRTDCAGPICPVLICQRGRLNRSMILREPPHDLARAASQQRGAAPPFSGDTVIRVRRRACCGGPDASPLSPAESQGLLWGP
jgi:hypothetical protein